MTAMPSADALADLLERLGGIAANRLVLQPPPGTATEADVIALEGRADKLICELIDGTLVEKAMGYNESGLASLLIELLNGFVRPRNLGMVTGEQGTLRLWPGRVRIPDVAFAAWERFPGRRRPLGPLPDVAPDLAVEVLSVSNTAREMRLKREDYFAAGTVVVWEVDPIARTVTVYTAVDRSTVLGATDTLDGGTVLPGLVLDLAVVFAELDRHG